jgi:LPXTG-motif cell wall-anchored protein
MADEKLILEKPEVIRHQMEETRHSLAEKLEVLEQKVASTVEGAANTVTDTVEAVKDSVHSTMDTVRELFDIRGHVDRHPWPMVGGAVVVGFLAGWLLTKKKKKKAAEFPRYAYADYAGGQDLSHGRAPAYAGNGSPNGSSSTAEPEKAKEKKESWFGSAAHALAPEIDKLKSLAIGTATSFLRDVVADAIPASIKPKVTEFMDDVTHKLGGEPIKGPVLSHFDMHHDDEARRHEPGFTTV